MKIKTSPKYVYRYEIILLIFSLIAIPGVKISGNIINLCDLLIPFLFIKCFFVKQKHITIDRTILWLYIYCLAALVSIFYAGVRNDILDFAALLKWVRLLYVPMVYTIVCFGQTKLNWEWINKWIVIAGICSAISAIVIFYLQTDYFAPSNLQTFYYDGKVMFRAGGVFGDPLSYAFMMAIVMISAINGLFKKNYIICNFIAIILSLVSITISGTRSVVLALLAVFLFYFLFETKIDIKKKLFILLSASVVFIIAYIGSGYFKNFIDTKIFVLFNAIINKDVTTIQMLSSGRANNWMLTMQAYNDSSFAMKLLGSGYKILNEVYFVDNNYILCLVTTGIIGATSVAIFWIKLIYEQIKRKFPGKTQVISLIITFLVMAFFVDVMTLYRNFAVFIMIMCFSKMESYR